MTSPSERFKPTPTSYTCVNDIDFPSLNSALEVLAADFNERFLMYDKSEQWHCYWSVKTLEWKWWNRHECTIWQIQVLWDASTCRWELLHIIDYRTLHSATLPQNGSLCGSVVLRQQGKQFCARSYTDFLETNWPPILLPSKVSRLKFRSYLQKI